MGRPIVETREAAARLKTSVSSASHVLRSMEKGGLVRRLRHGLWALHPDIEPFAVAPYLTAPFPAYISFWSALARHDMIEQIPRQIFVASPDRRRSITTTLGTYSIHHLTPELFDGYRGTEETGYLATSEKALFDTVYVRAPRGARAFFPELSLPEDFDETQLQRWTRRIERPRLRALVFRALSEALRQASREGEQSSTPAALHRPRRHLRSGGSRAT
jgi:predicted transcriptional regulator of viral defense system